MLQINVICFLLSVAAVTTTLASNNVNFGCNNHTHMNINHNINQLNGNTLGAVTNTNLNANRHLDGKINLALSTFRIGDVEKKLIDGKHGARMRRTTGTKSICFPVKKTLCKKFTVYGITKDYCITKTVRIVCTALD